MRTLIKLTIAAAIVVTITTSETHAQQSDFQSWTQVISTISLDTSNKWFTYFEVQPRIGDDISRLERLLIRPALGYNINPNVSLLLGYAWAPTYMNSSYEQSFRNENRIWQQILVKDSRWGFEWQHRLRQEQRFIEDAAGPSNRTRYLLRGSYPLSESKNFGLTGYNEIFFNLNSEYNGPKAGFDRDRYFFGPYLLQGPIRYEVGYVGEVAQQFDEDGGRVINAIMVMAFMNL
jgi:hypothetical protein